MKKFNKLALIVAFTLTASMALTAMGTTVTKARTIGAEKAKDIALTHAGLSKEKVQFKKAVLDHDDDGTEYDIVFMYNGVEYDYEISAFTGKVKSVDQEKKGDTTSGNSSTAKITIGAEKAKDIAIAHTGLSKDKVQFKKVVLDHDEDGTEYDVVFYYNGVEYDYEINAFTGKVKSVDQDDEDDRDTKPQTSTTTQKLIDAKKAKEIALAHAGLSEGVVREMSINQDDEDGITVYEVEFEHKDTEYDYEISAVTGAIITFNMDK